MTSDPFERQGKAPFTRHSRLLYMANEQDMGSCYTEMQDLSLKTNPFKLESPRKPQDSILKVAETGRYGAESPSYIFPFFPFFFSSSSGYL